MRKKPRLKAGVPLSSCVLRATTWARYSRTYKKIHRTKWPQTGFNQSDRRTVNRPLTRRVIKGRRGAQLWPHQTIANGELLILSLADYHGLPIGSAGVPSRSRQLPVRWQPSSDQPTGQARPVFQRRTYCAIGADQLRRGDGSMRLPRRAATRRAFPCRCEPCGECRAASRAPASWPCRARFFLLPIRQNRLR